MSNSDVRHGREPTVEAVEPEALVYAPAADGGLELVAVEWVGRGLRSLRFSLS